MRAHGPETTREARAENLQQLSMVFGGSSQRGGDFLLELPNVFG